LAGSHNPDTIFPYTPHVTFGLYRDAFPLPALMQRMRAGDAGPPMHLKIERLTLMVYEAAIIGGPLSSLCEFDLATRQIKRLDPALMETLFSRQQAHESPCPPADQAISTALA
jgi:hypothetical protein